MPSRLIKHPARMMKVIRICLKAIPKKKQPIFLLGMCFCPQCGTLAFPDQANNINCTNYKCGYKGQLTTVIKMDDGKVISGSEIVTKLSSSPTAEKVPCIGQGCSTLVSRSTGRCGHCAQFSGGMMPGPNYRANPW
tara:strand:+ start:2225 stop:2632 length:408 start_codon:yes stop_codon:yes gene_type:complete